MATIQTTPQLPTAEQLSDAWRGFADVEEHLLNPTLLSVFELLNAEGQQPVTYEQIGRLVAWADEIEAMATSVKNLAANMKEACIHDLPPIVDSHNGRNPHAPRFTRWGTRHA